MSSKQSMTAVNGKRPSSIPPRHQSHQIHQNSQNQQSQQIQNSQQSQTSLQHLALINYICDSWNTVSRELDTCNSSNYRNGASVTYYQEREPNPLLKDFEPFNLESYWGQRVVQSITTRNASS